MRPAEFLADGWKRSMLDGCWWAKAAENRSCRSLFFVFGLGGNQLHFFSAAKEVARREGATIRALLLLFEEDASSQITKNEDDDRRIALAMIRNHAASFH